MGRHGDTTSPPGFSSFPTWVPAIYEQASPICDFFNGLLATRLVRETLPQVGIPIVEAVGVMPLTNPFLQKAGMQAFAPPPRVEQVELIEALSAVGIEENELVEPASVQEKLDALPGPAADFIETHVRRFLKSHGRRRTMPAGIERTRYLVGKLTERPAYHIWFHPTLEVTWP